MSVLSEVAPQSSFPAPFLVHLRLGGLSVSLTLLRAVWKRKAEPSTSTAPGRVAHTPGDCKAMAVDLLPPPLGPSLHRKAGSRVMRLEVLGAQLKNLAVGQPGGGGGSLVCDVRPGHGRSMLLGQ